MSFGINKLVTSTAFDFSTSMHSHFSSFTINYFLTLITFLKNYHIWIYVPYLSSSFFFVIGIASFSLEEPMTIGAMFPNYACSFSHLTPSPMTTRTCHFTIVSFLMIIAFVAFCAIVGATKKSCHRSNDSIVIIIQVNVNLLRSFRSFVNDCIEMFFGNYYNLVSR